ncbi:uncharacterized protein [Ptychodera flava]|uniref:uncharacterized protein n=1 Tax=Ptychodera flava TaxID=63121 RepID=UPI00396A6190
MSKFRERQKKRATSKESPPRSRRSSPLVFPHNHSERLHRVAACQWCKKLSQEDPNAWAALQEAALAPPTAEISKSDATILEDFSITGFPLVELHDIMTSDDTRTERPTNLKGSQTEDADELSSKITQVINVLDPESQTGIEDTTNMDSSGKQGRLDTIIEKLHERLAPPTSMMTTSGTFRLT